jgi:DNA-binding response OmpR family regulator
VDVSVPPAAADLPASTAATILVCEDDPSLRLLLRFALEPRGHRVVEAGDGDAGIMLARSVRPDLVVVDMRLPDRGGIDVVRALRGDDAPVLIATGSSQPGDRLAAEDAGADAFVSKPFEIDSFVNELERLLSRNGGETPRLPLRRLQ